MQFNVAQLLKQSTGATRSYELAEEIEGLDPELQPRSLLTGTIKLLRTHSGVLASGQMAVTLEMTCNRCLELVQQQISFEIEENFRPLTDVVTGRFIMADEYEGQEEELVDSALIINDHHILDASEVIRQNIWLAAPMAPGCMYADAADCPNYLARMAEMESAHPDEEESPDEAVDPRWAALLALQARQAEE